MRDITKSLLESFDDGDELEPIQELSSPDKSIKNYTMTFLDGYIDTDVCDTDVDMMVCFCLDFNDIPDDNYGKLMNYLGEKTQIKKVNGDILVCDFTSVFKPYNEQLKELFDMDYSEFDEDEAYYEAVANLPPIISGNVSNSFCGELLKVLTGGKVDSEETEEKKDTNESVFYSYRPTGQTEGWIGKLWFHLNEDKYETIELYYDSDTNEYKLLYGMYVPDYIKKFIEDYGGYDKFLKDALEFVRNSGESNLKEAENMESTIDTAARYLFDEGNNSYLPDYEEFTDYTMEISEDLYDKAKERALNALDNLAKHNYYDHENHNKLYLELNHNFTILELDDEMPFDAEGYTLYVEKAAEDFEELTKTKMYFLGRSGRHVCVEPTYDNCLNFTYLQELQEKLEKRVIKTYNNYSKQWKEEQEKEDMNESANITAEVTYHNNDGTRDSIAGKLSDGRYFLIGQQEQIVVSTEDLPKLIKQDFENYNYDENNEELETVLCDTDKSTTIDNHSELAKVIINASKDYLDDGCYLLSEDAVIDKDPDLDIEQVNTDVDYWSDVDEANTEDVSNMEPIGVYTISNNMSILIYKIEDDINIRVLAGDTLDRTKAKWRELINEPSVYDEVDSYFYYGSIKVPFNEIMRTDI